LTVFVCIKIDAAFEAFEKVDFYFARLATAQSHGGDGI
jgi:hypothetical protein